MAFAVFVFHFASKAAIVMAAMAMPMPVTARRIMRDAQPTKLFPM